MKDPQRMPAQSYGAPANSRFCLLFVGHGSREGQANAHFQDSILAFQRRYPGISVFAGYIELAEPLYSEVLERIAGAFDHIRIVPIALFAAGHVKNDIPIAIDRMSKRFPSTRFELRDALGTSPLWVSHLHRLVEPMQLPEEESTLLIVGRGSSDAGANSAFFHMSRLIGEGVGLRHIVPSFVGITKPDYRESLRLIAKMRPQNLLVLPFFLYSGVLHQRLEKEIQEFGRRYPSMTVTVLPFLANVNGFDAVIDDRAFGSDEGQNSHLLPCHSCQYRVALGHLESQVGGINSLLYSLRHALTRQQANNHPHAHAKIEKHVFICTNRDCADRGSMRLARQLRRRIKDQEQSTRCRVTLTSCMGRCGEGPAIAVYPDGIWYRQMDEKGIESLVSEHIMQDRIVSDYVDTIL